jgi:hypothetical protein
MTIAIPMTTVPTVNVITNAADAISKNPIS